MNHYIVRTQKLGALGFLTQADHYRDYEVESNETLEEIGTRIAAKGFRASDADRWIMPGGIIWIDQKK